MNARSKKPKAVALVKWLSKKGVEKKMQEQHQQAIEEKDTKIALLNDDLKNRENDNVALQAQRDVQLQKCQDMIEKNTNPEEDEIYEFPYYVARIQRRFINTKK